MYTTIKPNTPITTITTTTAIACIPTKRAISTKSIEQIEQTETETETETAAAAAAAPAAIAITDDRDLNRLHHFLVGWNDNSYFGGSSYPSPSVVVFNPSAALESVQTQPQPQPQPLVCCWQPQHNAMNEMSEVMNEMRCRSF